MKRTLLSLFALLLTAVSAWADVTFDENTKYRFESKYYGTGSVILGTQHSYSPYFYYLSGTSYVDDSWWYIRKGSHGGYTISNASTGQYMTYTNSRVDGTCKGMTQSAASQGDESEWTFTQEGNYVGVVNVAETLMWWNLRVDGTYLLGTYEGSGTDNELFAIYDEQGNCITKGGESEGGSTTEEGEFDTEKGQTAVGEYWERTGISTPVVYTTDTTDPVLYSIINTRKSTYVSNDGSYLTQSTNSNDRTLFYFVESGSGVQIFTESGKYVSTSYLSWYQSYQYGLTLGTATPSGNIWALKWETGTDENSAEYKGYTLCKLDNLPSSSTGTGSGSGWGGGWGGGTNWNTQSSYLYWNDYNGANIGLYDVDDGSTFVFASSDERHVSHLAENGITFGGGGGSVTGNLYTKLDSIKIDGKDLVYDKSAKMFYYPLPEKLREGGDYDAVFTYQLKAGFADYHLTLDGQTADATTHVVTLSAPTCDRTYPIALVGSDGTEALTAELQFTFLPIVEATVSSCNGSYYTTGTIRVTSQLTEGYDSTFIAAFKYRGATAQSYNKKSYAVKLRDAEGNSVDRKLIGLRSDNNWILDAMVIDKNCMNNRVSTDLWNDFSVAPYYKEYEKKARTGTRGRFVEVFLNGKYHGLYCMTEKLDRKQLKLNKYKEQVATESDTIRGLLYKSTQWSYEVFMGHDQDSKYFSKSSPSSYTNTLGKETWASSFEQKYPDYEDEAVQWEPLYNAVKFVATSGQTYFDAHVKEYFDYPTLRDYYLFINLMLATDNHGKNMFYYVYDRTSEFGDKLGMCPWDLDGTWGQNWAGSTSYTSDATQDFETFLWDNEHGELTIFYNLNNSTTLSWADDLKERYAELRGTYFKPEALKERFASYASLFADSHADSREKSRWSAYHSQIQDRVEYTKNWIDTRVSTLDTKFGYDPTTQVINDAKAEGYFSAQGSAGRILVNAGSAQTVRVYNVSGALVRETSVGAGVSALDGFVPGAYVVNGHKVLVR